MGWVWLGWVGRVWEPGLSILLSKRCPRQWFSPFNIRSTVCRALYMTVHIDYTSRRRRGSKSQSGFAGSANGRRYRPHKHRSPRTQSIQNDDDHHHTRV